MKKNNYSNEIAATVKQFLDEDDWNYSFNEERGVFEFNLKMQSKIQIIKYLVIIRNSECLIYGISPIGADYNDKAMMTQMTEFICRANYGLRSGGFELNVRDGEIQYKCFIDCDGWLPSNEIIRNSIRCIAIMYDRYSTGITDIIFAGSSAKDAIDRCENSCSEGEQIRKALLAAAGDADADVVEAIARLSASFGITVGDDDENDGDEEDGEHDEDDSVNEVISSEEVHTDLFHKKTEE